VLGHVGRGRNQATAQQFVVDLMSWPAAESCITARSSAEAAQMMIPAGTAHRIDALGE